MNNSSLLVWWSLYWWFFFWFWSWCLLRRWLFFVLLNNALCFINYSILSRWILNVSWWSMNQELSWTMFYCGKTILLLWNRRILMNILRQLLLNFRLILVIILSFSWWSFSCMVSFDFSLIFNKFYFFYNITIGVLDRFNF